MYCPHKTPQSIQHRLLYTRRLYGCEKAITDKCRNNWRPTRQYVHGTCCSILHVVVTGRTSGAGCPAGNAHWIIQTNWLLCNVRAKLCIFYKRQRSIKTQQICDRRQRPTSGAETPVPSFRFTIPSAIVPLGFSSARGILPPCGELHCSRVFSSLWRVCRRRTACSWVHSR